MGSENEEFLRNAEESRRVLDNMYPTKIDLVQKYASVEGVEVTGETKEERIACMRRIFDKGRELFERSP